MEICKIIKYHHYIFNNSYTFKGHTHDSYEINIVLNGSLEVTIGQNVLQLNAHEAVLWKPMIFHCNKVVSSEDAEFLSIHFFSEENLISKNDVSFSILNHENMMLLNVLMDEREHDSSQNKHVSDLIFTALLLCLQKQNTTPQFSQQNNATLYHKAVTLMIEQQHKMLLLSEIAHSCGVCETTLKKTFKHHTGISIKTYYRNLKLKIAKEYLSAGKNATETAMELGYSSSSYFSQHFKRETGISVREYIKQIRPSDSSQKS